MMLYSTMVRPEHINIMRVRASLNQCKKYIYIYTHTGLCITKCVASGQCPQSLVMRCITSYNRDLGTLCNGFKLSN